MSDLEKTLSTMDFKYFGSGQHKIDPESFLKNEEAIFLDVRAKEETETVKILLRHHRIPVLEIPLHELPQRFAELPRDKFIGIFCSSGVRSAIALVYLKSKGLEKVKIIDGGYQELMEALKTGKIYKHINQ